VKSFNLSFLPNLEEKGTDGCPATDVLAVGEQELLEGANAGCV